MAAASPKQDAIIQLQSAGKLSPEEAAQKVFSQQGVQAGQPANVRGAKVARTFASPGSPKASRGTGRSGSAATLGWRHSAARIAAEGATLTA